MRQEPGRQAYRCEESFEVTPMAPPPAAALPVTTASRCQARNSTYSWTTSSLPGYNCANDLIAKAKKLDRIASSTVLFIVVLHRFIGRQAVGIFAGGAATTRMIARSSGASASSSTYCSPSAQARGPMMVAIACASPLRALLTSTSTIARCFVTARFWSPLVTETISPSSSSRSAVKRRAPLGRPNGFPDCPGLN